MNEEKQENKWIRILQRRIRNFAEITRRKKMIKKRKKEILQTYLQLGRQTYQSFLSQQPSDQIAPLSSLIQQQIAEIEELQRQIRQLRQGEEEADFIDRLF